MLRKSKGGDIRQKIDELSQLQMRLMKFSAIAPIRDMLT